MRKFYVIGISLLALFAFSAVAASSASAEGPWWIISLSATSLIKLVELLTEKILGEQDESTFLLVGLLVTIECKKMKYTGNLIGNNPGMDLEELKFEECIVAGSPNCLAENAGAGTITSNVFTVLAYGDDSEGKEVLTLALDAFFPDNKEAGNNTFTEFTLKEVAGTAGCGLLNGSKVVVNATGTEIGSVGELTDKEPINKKCGVLGELGLLNGSKIFEEALSGEEKLVGALSTEKSETSAWMLNIGPEPTDESLLIECKLEAFGESAQELGIATADIEFALLWGWESD